MIYWISVYMSFTVCIAALIAAIRFRKIEALYFPFIMCIWVAAINEIISFTLTQKGYSNIANNNIYILLEGILILWQFKRWDILHDYTFYLITLLLCCTWLYEIHSWQALQNLHYYYRLFYAAVIVICSISFNNRLIISHHNKLVTNPGFIICTGYILYFTLKMVCDAWWLYNPKSSTEFLTAVFFSMAGSNFITNLLFILAIIWIPRKPDYITF